MQKNPSSPSTIKTAQQTNENKCRKHKQHQHHGNVNGPGHENKNLSAPHSSPIGKHFSMLGT